MVCSNRLRYEEIVCAARRPLTANVMKLCNLLKTQDTESHTLLGAHAPLGQKREKKRNKGITLLMTVSTVFGLLKRLVVLYGIHQNVEIMIEYC